MSATVTLSRSQRAAVALAEHREQRAALLASFPRQLAPSGSNSIALARAAARAQLSEGARAHVARQRAARILIEQDRERRAVRQARADAREQLAAGTALEKAARQRPNLEQLAAKRRDEYRTALAYPMQPVEILRACMQAVEDARLPDDEDRAETVSELVRVVIRRHGVAPLRCDIGADWLKLWAERIYAREQRTREHKTGMRAAAAQLSAWRDQDREDGMSERDPVLWKAQNLPAPAPESEQRPETAAQLAYGYRERLALTARQAEALAVALQSHQRATLAMSGAERFAASSARAILRKRFPTAEALLVALRPAYGAALAVECASRIATRRASIAALGSHLAGQRRSASLALLSRFPLRPAGGMAAQRATRQRLEQRAGRRGPSIIGPQRFPQLYGDGYSGACSCLYLYRSGGRHTDQT